MKKWSMVAFLLQKFYLKHRTMSNYPEWLLPYKTEGVYAKKVKSGYALCRGHSERVPGKKYPVFKCDEYLGIVTEKDGLIPSSPPVKPVLKVYRFGMYCLGESLCSVLRNPLKRDGLDANMLYARALLSMEGRATKAGYLGSWLSVRFPGVDVERSLTEEEEKALKRLETQIGSKLKYGLGEDRDAMVSMSSEVYAVKVNEKWKVSSLPEGLLGLAESHGIEYKLKG